ncbi:MAG: hypothetical protein NTU98_03205 [Bacteroidetes bacterium]|nr:hypothetical protein [Bacteroidota bacterium]
MKTRILNFFKYDRSYSGGRTLYLEIGNNLAFKKNLCLREEHNIKGVLFDQLRQMAELTADQLKSILNAPIVVSQVYNVVDKGPESEKKITEKLVITEAASRNSAESDNIVTVPLPFPYLRGEFPFLKKTDCPDELHGLVVDFTSAIIVFNETFGVMDFLDSYIDGSQEMKNNARNKRKPFSIGEELDCYNFYLNKKGKQNRVDFSSRVKQLELTAFRFLVDLKKRLTDNIYQNIKNLKKDPSNPNNHARLKRHSEMKREHILVSLMLDF